MKAILNGLVLAESEETVLLGTERYFPRSTVREELLTKNGRVRFCHWKGHGDLYDILVGEIVIRDGAWSYAHPFWEAEEVQNMIAFSEENVSVS